MFIAKITTYTNINNNNSSSGVITTTTTSKPIREWQQRTRQTSPTGKNHLDFKKVGWWKGEIQIEQITDNSDIHGHTMKYDDLANTTSPHIMRFWETSHVCNILWYGMSGVLILYHMGWVKWWWGAGRGGGGRAWERKGRLTFDLGILRGFSLLITCARTCTHTRTHTH